MKGYKQLTLAQLRIFARNRQVLIWTLLFPLILMIAMGTFAGKDTATKVTLGIVKGTNNQDIKTLISVFENTPGIEVKQFKEKEKGIEGIQQGDVLIVLDIPKDFTLKNSESTQSIPLYYDETNLNQAQLGMTVVNSVLDGFSKNQQQYTALFETKPEGMQGVKVRYIDFLVPGIVALMIMSNNMNGVAGQIAAWRERGILRRMQGTRLKASTFIAAQITARLLLNGVQALLVLVIANLVFGVSVQGSWLTLIAFVIIGTLAFMSLGFIIAGIAKTPESAGPIAGLLTFPMLFLGGVFFPISNMPDLLQPVVKILPISHLSTALRETMNIGVAATTLWPHLLILLGWLAFGFITASKTFKWDYE